MAGNHFNVLGGPLGNQQISSGQLPDTTQRQESGLIVQAASPVWGGAEFIYGYASGTIGQFGLCTVTPTITSGEIRHEFAHVPNTANLGQMVAVAMTSMTAGQWGWFMIAGMTPINGTANVAANTAFGITAAGQIGAISAGKQILNARSILASSTTVAKTNVTGLNGSYQITVPNSDLWFIGLYLSGTGIGSGALIEDISADGKVVTLDVANDAAVTGTVTGTFNNATIYYNVAYLNRPFAQGQDAVT